MHKTPMNTIKLRKYIKPFWFNHIKCISSGIYKQERKTIFVSLIREDR